MEEKETKVQKALGHTKHFNVMIEVPIKMIVRVTQQVEAVNKEDAIEKTKLIRSLVPKAAHLDDIRQTLKRASYYGPDMEFDGDIECKYSAHEQYKDCGSNDCVSST